MKRSTRFIASLLLLLAVLIGLDRWNDTRPAEDASHLLAAPDERHSITSYRHTDQGTEIEFLGREDAYLVLPWSHASPFFPHYLDLSLSPHSGADFLDLYWATEGNGGFSERRKETLHLEAGKNHYRLFLPPGRYSRIRLDLTSRHLEKGSLTIKSLRCQPTGFISAFQLSSYPVAALLLLALLLPGLLLFALFSPGQRLSRTWHDILIFPLSLAFLFTVYLVHVLTLASIGKQPLVPGAYWLLAQLVLLAGVFRQRRFSAIRELLGRSRPSYVVVFALLFLSVFIVTYPRLSPFSTTSYQTITERKIFSAFNGGDNSLQYYNGMAIADDEPFATYYRNLPPWGVQDRQILPGVAYGVMRVVLKNFSEPLSRSYLTYTLFGTCLNLMLLFPVSLLFRRFFRVRQELLALLFFSANAFVLANYYYTWFKSAGAALFLGGLACLLLDSGRLRHWLLAGLLFGLSAAFHAGNALGLPLIVLWFLVKEARKNGIFSRQALLGPLFLSLCFLLPDLPWSLIKSHFFPDQQILFRMHFLDSTPFQGGLPATIQKFFATHPWPEQLSYRLSHLPGTLRLDRVIELLAMARDSSPEALFFSWANNEFFFFIFPLYQLLFLLITTWGILLLSGPARGQSLLAGGIKKGLSFPPGEREPLQLAVVSLTTILILIFVCYTPGPDVNHALPYGPVLLLHITLISLIAKAGRSGTLIMAGASLFSFYRLLTVAL